MTTPNHIAGGVVFTGVFCSLWNVNIFASPVYTSVLIFGALLPDIDHTKSIIGKIFFPIAYIIQRKFGHRTVTHSLTFLLAITLFTFYTEKVFLNSHSISLILFFSVLSHLIFDMMTITGVPLFYPFIKNPCVIPGNINYRIRTGDLKTEGIFLFMFTLIGFSLISLFQNGFWNSYNIVFEDYTHIARLYNTNQNEITITADYTLFNNSKNTSGIIAFADEKNIYIKQTDNKIVHLNKDNQGLKINKLETSVSQQIKEIKKQNFNAISVDSFNILALNKFFYKADIYANSKIIIQEKTKNQFHFTNTDDIHVLAKDTIIVNTDLEYQINDIEIKLNQEYNKLNDYIRERNQLKSDLQHYESEASQSADLYTINNAKNNIIKLKSELKKLHNPYNSIALLQNQLAKLKAKNNTDFKVLLTGNLVYLEK